MKEIWFSILYVNQDLGHMLLAKSEAGISALYFGDAPAVLIKQLENICPTAQFYNDPKALAAEMTAALAVLDGIAQPWELGLSFDLGGSPFQQSVWQQLMMIPCGQTRTYGEIAAAIGDANAVRAVGTACGYNNVALLIPCHRVIRSDGELGGYRWGVGRKSYLLAHEDAMVLGDIPAQLSPSLHYANVA